MRITTDTTPEPQRGPVRAKRVFNRLPFGHIVFSLHSEIASGLGAFAFDLSHAVTEALAHLPQVEIRSGDPKPRVDGRVLDLAILGKVNEGRHVRFLIEAKANGYPRDEQAMFKSCRAYHTLPDREGRGAGAGFSLPGFWQPVRRSHAGLMV